jgi:hypothetical protein
MDGRSAGGAGLRRALAAAAATLALVGGDVSASAAELQLELAPALGASSWRGDYTVGTQLRLGVRISRVIAIDSVGWEQIASVDRRANTGLTFGVTGFLPLEGVRPFLRAFGIHQHEEGLVSVEAKPFGTLFGIGPGIRHRAGVGSSLGAEIPFRKNRGSEWYAVAGATTVWFSDAKLGPELYFTLFGGVGINFDVKVGE